MFCSIQGFQEIKVSLSFSLHLIINLGNSITLSFLNFDLKSGFIYLFSYPWIFLAIFWIIHISLYKKEKNPEWEWDSLFYLFLFSLLLVRVFGFWSSEYLFIFIRRKILFDFTVVKFGLCTNSNSVAYRVKWLGWFFRARIRVWQRPLFWVSSPLLPWLLHPHFTVIIRVCCCVWLLRNCWKDIEIDIFNVRM